MTFTDHILAASRRARLKIISYLLRREGIDHLTVFDPNRGHGAVILSTCLWKDDPDLDIAVDRTNTVAEDEIPNRLVDLVLTTNYDYQDAA